MTAPRIALAAVAAVAVLALDAGAADAKAGEAIYERCAACH